MKMTLMILDFCVLKTLNQKIYLETSPFEMAKLLRKNFEEFGNVGDFQNVQRHGKNTKILQLNNKTFITKMI